MRFFYFLLYVFGASSCTAFATPWGMPGDAVIVSNKGHLNICMPTKTLEGVTLHSIVVTEHKAHRGISTTMWNIQLERNAVPKALEGGDCYSYGDKVADYAELVPARLLSVEGIYIVRVNVDVINAVRTSILFYDAIFCVSRLRTGELSYLQDIANSYGGGDKPLCSDVK